MKDFVEDHRRAIGIVILAVAFVVGAVFRGENVQAATFVAGFVGLLFLFIGR
jgi:hypothetical protein